MYIQICRWENLNLGTRSEINRGEGELEKLDLDIWDLNGGHGDALQYKEFRRRMF